jgi:hypothetical protein
MSLNDTDSLTHVRPLCKYCDVMQKLWWGRLKVRRSLQMSVPRSWQTVLRVLRVAKNIGLCPHVKNHRLGRWMFI